ncbi:hypothetical protein BDP27DRAFT_15877 [Rhodocollybia butyracea]|uniref:Protein SMG7 n=1 Tax=Rhodocollybia butyracea TaxID=206335 RepID=A0A9P5QAD9_9AGAR|nr:hypothetical protein BDP27DRAFT_15877 [Rhodocollybia butyracea]
MSDQNPSAILREAKGIHATIKELLKTKEPFEKEIDFQRKNLRRRYLNLLLVHPYTKESDNVETHLWMQTSYSFISDYKQRLARIERATQRQPPGQSRHGPVEYRKLLQRFRQFLADEDKFWTQFVVRYHRSFSLDEAHPALVALGLVSEVADSPEELSPINGRNHFQFPPSTSFAPTSSSDRESRLTIVSKALVCLGDIARYREQYNESGGRSRVGPEEEGKGRKRNKRGGPPIADIPRPRNFERARTCYEQAKLLTPHDGNPSHQLAIIASYEKDMFTSLVHYYRSLCVKHPYETASENMAGLLSRTLEQRNTSGKKEVPPDIAHVPKVLIEEFKHKVVVLHALWRLGNESDDSTMVKEASNIYARFYDLVSERHLPEDFITRLVTLAQGALWKIRMLQDASSNNIKSRPRSFVASLPSPVIEARIYTHLLSLFRALLQVSIEKLKEPPPVDSDKDLAQRLIVEFRRTLPAMRIAGKWLRANYKYVMGDPEAQGNRKGKAKHTTESSGIISPLSTETIDFWRTYAEFLRALSRTFPQDRLPDLNFALTEDIEMKGFRPLKGYMDLQRNTNGTNGKEGLPLKESEVHPNDLHLMRIKDILSDAKALVEMENSPLAIYGNQFVVRGVESQVQPIPSMLPPTINQPVSPAFREQEDDAMTELTSNTDDAVIRDAFTHLNEGDDDDDDDEVDRIVWDPNPRFFSVTSMHVMAMLNIIL